MTTTIYFALSISVSFISIMQSVKRVQFLDTLPLFLSSNCFDESSAPAPVIATVLLTVYMHHYNHINLILTFKFKF